MDDLIKVEGHSSLARDESSSAIVNTDVYAYTMAKKRRLRIQTQEIEINSLKEEVKEVKSLLKVLIESMHG